MQIVKLIEWYDNKGWYCQLCDVNGNVMDYYFYLDTSKQPNSEGIYYSEGGNEFMELETYEKQI